MRQNDSRQIATIFLLVVFAFCFFAEIFVLGKFTGGITWAKFGLDVPVEILDKLGGTAYGLTIESGQWWRLLTAIVLHGSIIHLIFNAIAMWRIGGGLEPSFGPARITTAFVLTGIVGALASGIFNHSATSIGASGGIFGLLGFGVACGVRSQEQFIQQLQRNAPNLFMVFISSAFIPNVDNYGHAGGLISGLLLGVLDARLPNNLRQPLFIVSTIAIAFATIKIIFNALG